MSQKNLSKFYILVFFEENTNKKLFTIPGKIFADSRQKSLLIL